MVIVTEFSKSVTYFFFSVPNISTKLLFFFVIIFTNDFTLYTLDIPICIESCFVFEMELQLVPHPYGGDSKHSNKSILFSCIF